MRKSALAAVLLAATLSAAQATAITLASSPTGRTVVDAGSTTLPNGDLVLLGTFANPGGVSLFSGSAASILSGGQWTQFDSSLAIGSAAGSPGKLVGTATDINHQTAVFFDNKIIYVVLFNASTQAAATQMGIFTNPTTTGGGAWTFPVDTGGLGDFRTLDSDQTGFNAVGGVGTVIGSGVGSKFMLVALVPEPSAIGLVGSGIFGLLGICRLRRQA